MELNTTNVERSDGTWTNLTEIGVCAPRAHHYPSSVSEVMEVVRQVRAEKGRCRFAGAGCSPNTCTFTNDNLIHMDRLNRILSVDTEALTITCEGGVLMETMMLALNEQGLMLKCVPSYVKTTVAGCLATATHSSGQDTRSLCDYVLRMSVVDGTGTLQTFSESRSIDDLSLAACHLGALGAVVEVTLRVEQKSEWHLSSRPVPMAEAMDAAVLASKVSTAEYYRYWWVPHTGVCYESVGTRADLGNPSADVSARHQRWVEHRESAKGRAVSAIKGNWLRHSVVQRSLYVACSYPALQPYINQAYAATFYSSAEELYGSALECFTFDCFFKQWANEWAIDADKAVEAFARLQRLIAVEGLHVHFPTEFRFTGADRTAMSPAVGRPTCWVGIVMYRPLRREAPDTQRYYDGFCQIMAELGGRPHWAKYYDWDSEQLTNAYGSNWENFKALRARMDPDSIFVNGWLHTLLNEGRHNSTDFVVYGAVA